MTAYMYNRYVDDTTNGMKALAPGMRWGEDEQAMGFLPHLVDEDMERAADERTMREVVRMGSSLDASIQLTGDCPSLNESGKMPLLDTQVTGVGGEQHGHVRALQEACCQRVANAGDVCNARRDEKDCFDPRSGENQEKYSSETAVGDNS